MQILASQHMSRPAVQFSPAGRRHATPGWRLHAASAWAPEPKGPFSFWPRLAGEAAKAKQSAPAKAPASAWPRDEPSADSSADFEPEHPTLGKQHFRSALEQVRSTRGWLWGVAAALTANRACRPQIYLNSRPPRLCRCPT